MEHRRERRIQKVLVHFISRGVQEKDLAMRVLLKDIASLVAVVQDIFHPVDDISFDIIQAEDRD